MNDVQLPVNVEAEAAVLGSILVSRKALDEVTELLQARDFHVPRHQTVYAAARRLHDAEEPVDVVTVVDELGRAGELQAGLDAAFAHGLVDSVATATNAGFYAGIVRDHSIRRQVLEAAQRAAKIATDQSVEPSALAELAREKFDEVGDDASVNREVETVGDWIIDYFGTFGETVHYTRTPWFDLDNLITGFMNGGVYIVAARPSVGKTVIALQMSKRIAADRPVLFVSLEMSRGKIANRLIAQTGQVFLDSLNKMQLSDTEWRMANAARIQIQELPLVVCGPEEVQTIAQLKVKARKVKRKFGQWPVIVVDYLQLLAADAKAESRQLEVAA